jgi:hypothetical protein
MQRIFHPLLRVIAYIFGNAIVIRFVTDDVFIIIALPYRSAGRNTNFIDTPAYCTFKSTYHCPNIARWRRRGVWHTHIPYGNAPPARDASLFPFWNRTSSCSVSLWRSARLQTRSGSRRSGNCLCMAALPFFLSLIVIRPRVAGARIALKVGNPLSTKLDVELSPEQAERCGDNAGFL